MGILLPIRGLRTSRNEALSEAEGALETANDVLIDSDLVAQPRPGNDNSTAPATGFGTDVSRGNACAVFQATQVVNYGNANSAKLTRVSAGAWSDYSGTYPWPASNIPPTFLEAEGRLWITTSIGVFRLETIAGAWALSGVPAAIHFTLATTGSSGFLADTASVAYRVVWGYRASDGRISLGRPSQRVVVTNTAGGGATRDVALTVYVPSGITTSHFVQVYRSAQIVGTPTEEMALVYEKVYVSGTSISITDTTPDAARGEPGYFTPSQGGLILNKDRPPAARDIALYNGSMFYASPSRQQRLTLRILSTAASVGVTVGDTVTIAGVVYTAHGSEDVSTNKFQVFTAGTASANIENTALSLVNIINRSASNTTVYAYYLSGVNDAPGKILVESRTSSTPGALVPNIVSPFVAIASAHGEAWNPPLPTSGTTISSTNDFEAGAVDASTIGEPDSVPLKNRLYPGDPDKEVYRIIPQNGRLYVFKADGIFTISGLEDEWIVDEVDPTRVLIAPRAAAPVDNKIFALTREGVIAVSPGGVANVWDSKLRLELEGLLRGLSTANLFTFIHGAGLEQQGLYALFTPFPGSSSAQIEGAYVYNVRRDEWTRWLVPFRCTTYSSNVARFGESAPITAPTLYGCPAVVNTFENLLFQFNPVNASLDNYNGSLGVTISTIVGNVVTLSGAPADTNIGDAIISNQIMGTITDISGAILTLDSATGMTTGSAVIYRAQDWALEWAAQAADDAGGAKQFTKLLLHFKEARFVSGRAYFYTDLAPTYSSAVVFSGTTTPNPDTQNLPSDSSNRPIHIPIPQGSQRGTKFKVKITIQQALGMWKLEAGELVGEVVGRAVSK